MAPLDQYLIPDENAEIALARSAALAFISDAAEIKVLMRAGYVTSNPQPGTSPKNWLCCWTINSN
jgi:hypothetical protein